MRGHAKSLKGKDRYPTMLHSSFGKLRSGPLFYTRRIILVAGKMRDTTTVLNVDDNEAARYWKARALRAAGYEVANAASGSDALAAVAQAKPKVALIDIKLPDMSGFELTRRLRNDDPDRQMRIIQVSAVAVTSDDENDGLESGADAYLAAPFDVASLLAVVAQLVHDGKAEPARRMSRIANVKEFVARNLTARLSLEDLAEVASLSPFHFTRVFKAQVGMTPHEFVVQQRVERAKALLREGAMNAGDVAVAAGFGSHAHFSIAFKRREGVSPGEFRRQSHGS